MRALLAVSPSSAIARGRAARSFSSIAPLRNAQPCTRYLQVTHPDDATSQETTDLLTRFQSYTLSTYSRPPLLFTHGNGLSLHSASSNPSYLDFSAGIAVNALGHADPQVAQLAAEQAHKLVHVSNLYNNEWSGRLAELLVELTRQEGGLGFQTGTGKGVEADSGTPVEPAKAGESRGLKVFLANSGTEANEGALKFARKVGSLTSQGSPNKKTSIVSFTNCFHGRTMGALSATHNAKYQAPFAPLVPGFKEGVFNQMEGLEELVDESVCGVIVEPIQGEGGVWQAKTKWLEALRKRCDEVGAVLIYDEIQCGLYRTGKLWAHSSLPVSAHPDIVTMAKPLANGFPIGAILMRDRIADVIAIGDHGTTFGGGPLASRIAHHVLLRLSQPDLVRGVEGASKVLVSRLSKLPNFFPTLVSAPSDKMASVPRGRGLILGFSLKDSRWVSRLVGLVRERGALILSAGKDAIRLVPSLTVSEEEANHLCDVLESSLEVLRREVDGERTQ